MKYVLTDCFDTLVIRREHPYQIYKRWAQCVCRLYPQIDSDDLYSERIRMMKEKEVDKFGINCVYEELYRKYESLISEKACFFDDLKRLERICEESALRKNDKVIDFLKRKKDQGCRLYCVTDYHLFSEDIGVMLVDLGVDFIDGVFSSASCGKTKHNGNLYRFVLEELEANPQDCLMIGDNKIADIQNARSNEVLAKYFPNSLHKNLLRIENILGIEKYSVKAVGKWIWKNSDTYDEFSLVFYTFCVRLYNEAIRRGNDKIVFLAREGLFLKKCFETYQKNCIPEGNRINTDYLKCSRRAIHSVQREKCLPEFYKAISVRNYFISIGFSEEKGIEMAEQIGINDVDKVIDDFAASNEARLIWDKLGSTIEERIAENKNAFDEYVHGIAAGNVMLLVDVGWIGRMQQGIDILFDDITTIGCYIGIYQNLFEKPFVERHGLVFNKSEDGKDSKYFSIFRSNIQFYEQLLAAPHGSACFYGFENGKPCVYEKWDSEEELLYKEVIGNLQDKLIRVFEGLCTYTFVGVEEGCEINSPYNKQLASIMLRSSLVQSRRRLDFMERLIQGFSQNFQQQTIGMKFSAGEIEEKKTAIIFHPEKFVRYIAKLGVVSDRKGMNGAGRFLMRCFYIYTKLLNHI